MVYVTEAEAEKPAASRTEILRIRVSKAGVDAIDHYRNGWSRSEYVRQALGAFIKAKRSGPTGSDL